MDDNQVSNDNLSIDIIFVDTENKAIKIYYDWRYCSDDIFNKVIKRLEEIRIINSSGEFSKDIERLEEISKTYGRIDNYINYVAYFIHNKDNNIQDIIGTN